MSNVTNKTVQDMWTKYLETINEDPVTTELTYESWKFETSKDSSNYLADLVKKGKKTGTSSTKDNFENVGETIPSVGDLHIITDWDNTALFIIRTTAVNIVPYKDVTEEFAKKEGEGDLSLKYWQDVHESIFIREQHACGEVFSYGTEIVCEEFELVFKY